METNNICSNTRQDEHSCTTRGQFGENLLVCAVDSNESFHTADNNQDKLNVIEKETAIGRKGQCRIQDEQSDLEQYITSLDQLEDSETSGSISKKMVQNKDVISVEQPIYAQKRRDCRSSHVKSRDSSNDSRRKKLSPSSRNHSEQRSGNCKFQPVAPEFHSYMNPTYEYSELDDDWVTPLGQTYNAQHQGRLNTPSPTGASRPNTQHKVRTGSTTRSHSSFSPSSPRSRNSNKSNTHRQIVTDNTGPSSTNRSPLPIGCSKTSTPYKSQHSSTSQGQSSRTALPAGMTANNSTTNTPQKLPSHNTSMQSESVVCRICHDGDGSEVLISPCYCAGSMGLLHVSCLQRWLGSSNKTSCEICNFEFALQKKTMPISQFLKEPGTAQDRRNLVCDLACFLMITPLTIVVTWICLHGAVTYYANSQMEKTGLIGLAISLVLLFAVWVTVAARHNWRLWKDWKMFHQEVTLRCTPSPIMKSQNVTTRSVESRSTLGSVQLQSIRVSVQGPMTGCKGGKRNKRRRKGAGKRGTSDHSSHTSRKRPDHKDQSQDRAQTRRTIPPISQNILDNVQNHEDGVQYIQGEIHLNRCQSKRGQDMRNYYVNEESQYYNTEAQREVKNQTPTAGIQHLNQKNFRQDDNKSYRSHKESSECSSSFSKDKQQRRKLRSDIYKQEHFDKSNSHGVYSKADGHSCVVNAANMPSTYENNCLAKAYNSQVNTEYSRQDPRRHIHSQQQAFVGHHASVNSRRSAVDDNSHDSLQDFVTKWVNDQTDVLVRHKQQMNGQNSTDSRAARVLGADGVPDNGKSSRCGKSHEISRDRDAVKSIGSGRNNAVIRKPATLSRSSSDISFEQVMKENNLASGSLVGDSDENYTHPVDKLLQ